jgi:hypothetical protein
MFSLQNFFSEDLCSIVCDTEGGDTAVVCGEDRLLDVRSLWGRKSFCAVVKRELVAVKRR